jgi:hypothetical protein
MFEVKLQLEFEDGNNHKYLRLPWLLREDYFVFPRKSKTVIIDGDTKEEVLDKLSYCLYNLGLSDEELSKSDIKFNKSSKNEIIERINKLNIDVNGRKFDYDSLERFVIEKIYES